MRNRQDVKQNDDQPSCNSQVSGIMSKCRWNSRECRTNSKVGSATLCVPLSQDPRCSSSTFIQPGAEASDLSPSSPTSPTSPLFRFTVSTTPLTCSSTADFGTSTTDRKTTACTPIDDVSDGSEGKQSQQLVDETDGATE